MVEKEKLPDRHVVGIIVFEGEKFLLLHRVLNWKGWEYPKGGIEEKEAPLDAVKRELYEETGIKKFELVGEVDSFEFFDKLHKRKVFVKSFLVRVPSTVEVTLNNEHVLGGEVVIEHDSFKWCFPKDALKMLTHENTKDSLKRAIKMLGISMD
jgi:8-oxo-dGTP pyrophosphatase MutT (NUDIX family)